VICSLVAEGDEPAKALAEEIGHRQEVALVDAAGLAAELDPARPGYRVVFGMDVAGDTLPAEHLRLLLRDGPGHGAHLLSWWCATRRFGAVTGGEEVAGMVFLDCPARDVSTLLGRPVDWQPREDRALFCDRHTDREVLMVPFAGAETVG
jgi:hypothetical protein